MTNPAQQPHATMQLALAQGATLGQALGWDGAHAAQGALGRWWWTDSHAERLCTWSPSSGQVSNYRMPDRVGAIAHCRSGKLLIGLAKRLGHATLLADAPALQVQPLVAVDAFEPRTRINDGRTDRRGYFVFGTLNEAPEPRPIGSFYQYSQQHGLRRLALPAVAAANSICFSVDGATMYFSDSQARAIFQCDYDAETASVARVRLFATIDAENVRPAGSVIDRDGCLWNAQTGAGRVVCYGPDGRQRTSITLPVSTPTSVAFGGSDQNLLTVTTARHGLTREELLQMPLAGSLFSITLDAPLGLPDALFDDDAVELSQHPKR